MVNVEAPGVFPAPPVVLIVENDRDTRELYETVFKLEGFSVDAVDDADAISHATEVPPDVIVTDVGLPGGCDGVFIAKSVHALPHSPDVPVIAVTSRNRTDIAPDAEFCAVLQKPVLPSELIDATRRALAASAALRARSEAARAQVPRLLEKSERLLRRSGRLLKQMRPDRNRDADD
jgi:CheY-like chemotaxis protein